MKLGNILLGGLGGLGGLMLAKSGINPLNALFGVGGMGMQPFGQNGLQGLFGGRQQPGNVNGGALNEEGSPFANLDGIGNMNFLGNLGGMFR